MKNWRRVGGATGVVVTAILLLVGLDAPSAEQKPKTDLGKTRAAMRGIFITLTNTYKYALRPGEFEDPANRAQIRGTLEALAANARELEARGGGLDPSFEYLRRSLSRDADDALDRFNRGQYMGSRFVLNKITENCVTCHTKLPSNREFDLGRAFLRDPDIRKLPPPARVDIEIATRQFRTALKTYESIFRDKRTLFETLSLMGAFEKYTRICVGALDDPARAAKEFRRLAAARGDLSMSQKKLLNSWASDLEAPIPSSGEGGLVAAKKLIGDAPEKWAHPADRTRLVKYIRATALLHQYLGAGNGSNEETADAYFLLGVAEAYIARSYWISETDVLLEQAIRRAPESPAAKKALAFLEEYTLSGHLQTSAREVSPALRANLDELRSLVEH